MKILIIQPKLEQQIEQLEHEIQMNSSVDVVIFPEGYLNEYVEQACVLAKSYNTVLIGGYRNLQARPKTSRRPAIMHKLRKYSDLVIDPLLDLTFQ
jgi:hypothetical protein